MKKDDALMPLDAQLKFRLPKDWRQQLVELGQPLLDASDMGRLAVKEFLDWKGARTKSDPSCGNMPHDAVLTIRLPKDWRQQLVELGQPLLKASDMARLAVREFLDRNRTGNQSDRPEKMEAPSTLPVIAPAATSTSADKRLVEIDLAAVRAKIERDAPINAAELAVYCGCGYDVAREWVAAKDFPKVGKLFFYSDFREWFRRQKPRTKN